MSRNIHFTPQHSKSVAPPASESAEDVAARTLGVDANTYWTDKDYTFGIVNRYAHARWYRLTVTKLQRGADYTIYTSLGRLDEDVVFEVAPGDEFAVTISFGGDQGRDPRAPIQFEVYVQEYVTRDEDSPHEFVMNEMLRWIPRPNAETIFLTTPSREIRVRPWPWKQRVKFEASLVNRSYLPITANVRALPGEDGIEAGLEGAQERLSEAVPPLREQPVLCDIMLEKRLTKPVLLTVDAQTRIPDLEMDLTTSPSTVLITPIGFLKVWHDWLVVGVAALLVFFVLYDIPPFVHPRTTVSLTLQDLPRNARPDDLVVKITPTSKDGRQSTLEYRQGRARPGWDKGAFVYDFDWGMMLKGLRWTWRDEDLKMTIEPKSERKALYEGYDFASIPLKGDGVDGVTISRRSGVRADQVQAVLSRKPGVNLLVSLDRNTMPKDDEITLNILVNGKAMTPVGYVEGDLIPVPDDMVSKHNTFEVRVTATNKAGTLEAHQTVHPLPQTASIPVMLPPFVKIAVNTPPVTPPIVPTTVPTTGGVAAVADPKKQAAGTPPAAGPGSKTTPLAGGPGTAGDHGQAGGMGGGNHAANPASLKPDAEVVKWCGLLQIGEMEKPLSVERKKSGLKIAVELHVTRAGDNPEVRVSITPTEDCWCQLYDVDKKRGGIVALLAGTKKDGVSGEDEPQPNEKQNLLDGRPVFIAKDKPFTFPGTVSDGYMDVGVLAVSQPASTVFDKDLIPWLKEHGVGGFAIGGVAYP